MALTPSGIRLQAGVNGAFPELSAALGSIRTRQTDAEITVSLQPVMATRWLVPRLFSFQGAVSADQSEREDRSVADQFQI